MSCFLVIFQRHYVWNKVGDPDIFFSFAFLTQVAHYLTEVKVRKNLHIRRHAKVLGRDEHLALFSAI